MAEQVVPLRHRPDRSESPSIHDERDEVATVCDYCDGDGTDPWNDHVLLCPVCGGTGLEA